METKVIKEIFSALNNSIKNENIELYKAIIDQNEIPTFNDPESFFYAVMYPHDKFISGFLKSAVSENRDVRFIYKNSQILDRHFSNLFVKYEGSACSSDKSRTIVRRLADFYETGKEIEFDYDAEYTYHLPKKILKTHDHIVLLYQAIKSLLYGDHEPYIKALLVVL